MPRWGDVEDDDDEDLDDEPEGDEDDDFTAPCSRCGASIFEDSERCASCGAYLSKEDAPPARRPWWLIVGVAACLYAIYRSIFGG